MQDEPVHLVANYASTKTTCCQRPVSEIAGESWTTVPPEATCTGTRSDPQPKPGVARWMRV